MGVMDTGLYSGVSALRTAEKRMEAITANLANVDTPGFKRQAGATRAFTVPGAAGYLEVDTKHRSDFSQGDLEGSSSPYHLAIDGRGWFVTEGQSGEVYTRRGNFRVDGAGVLQTSEGNPVAWEASSSVIDPHGDLVQIDAHGTVRQGDREIGRLRVTDFEEDSKLQSIGGGYFTASEGMREVPAEGAVHQGHLERSNVSSMDELVSMITVQRSFESANRLVQMINRTYERLLQQRIG
jgi:flagellar basal-body rod protein FlgF